MQPRNDGATPIELCGVQYSGAHTCVLTSWRTARGRARAGLRCEPAMGSGRVGCGLQHHTQPALHRTLVYMHVLVGGSVRWPPRVDKARGVCVCAVLGFVPRMRTEPDRGRSRIRLHRFEPYDHANVQLCGCGTPVVSQHVRHGSKNIAGCKVYSGCRNRRNHAFSHCVIDRLCNAFSTPPIPHGVGVRVPPVGFARGPRTAPGGAIGIVVRADVHADYPVGFGEGDRISVRKEAATHVVAAVCVGCPFGRCVPSRTPFVDDARPFAGRIYALTTTRFRLGL